MRKQKRIMICFCLLLGMSLVGCGVLKGFDAEAYTEAVLKQRLSGDTKAIARLTEEMSEEELTAQYEKEVQTFVAGYITKDVSMGEELTEKYTALCSEIFKSLKYETAKAEKKDKNTYDVNVDIYPTDIFVTFSEKLKHPADEMIQKAENGEYKGTEEEIKTQMQSEFLEYSYTLLEESFEGAQNGKKETVVLTISNKEKKGFAVVKVNSKKGGGIKSIQGVIQEACKEKMERDRKRGILNRPVRAMVVGIPNVGKSTFINSLAGKACAKTGNKPGVTKGKQWIRLNKNVELLDTPGILWPKFEDQTVGLRLAFIGSIKDEILNTEELAAELIQFMKKHYAGVLAEKYAITEVEDPYACLTDIAKNRHCLLRGSELDTNKAAMLLIDDFRNGRLGKITLEFPEDYE